MPAPSAAGASAGASSVRSTTGAVAPSAGGSAGGGGGGGSAGRMRWRHPSPSGAASLGSKVRRSARHSRRRSRVPRRAFRSPAVAARAPWPSRPCGALSRRRLVIEEERRVVRVGGEDRATPLVTCLLVVFALLLLAVGISLHQRRPRPVRMRKALVQQFLEPLTDGHLGRHNELLRRGLDRRRILRRTRSWRARRASGILDGVVGAAGDPRRPECRARRRRRRRRRLRRLRGSGLGAAAEPPPHLGHRSQERGAGRRFEVHIAFACVDDCRGLPSQPPARRTVDREGRRSTAWRRCARSRAAGAQRAGQRRSQRGRPRSGMATAGSTAICDVGGRGALPPSSPPPSPSSAAGALVVHFRCVELLLRGGPQQPECLARAEHGEGSLFRHASDLLRRGAVHRAR